MTKAKAYALMLVAAPLAGCALMQPAEDPMEAKVAELEKRVETIERVVDNQSLVQLTQQVGIALAGRYSAGRDLFRAACGGVTFDHEQAGKGHRIVTVRMREGPCMRARWRKRNGLWTESIAQESGLGGS